MENPIDHVIDLGLVNYVPHPENKNYVVFRFTDANRAESFETLLQAENIWFEKGEEDKRGKNYYLFGINNKDFKKAEKINYKVEGMHKKPIIPFKGFRYTLMIISALLMTLTLIGYCKAQTKIDQANRTTIQSIAE